MKTYKSRRTFEERHTWFLALLFALAILGMILVAMPWR